MSSVEERIKNAKHQSKPDKASVVIYDGDGNWVSEMYLPIDWSVKVGGYRIFLEDTANE